MLNNMRKDILKQKLLEINIGHTKVIKENEHSYGSIYVTCCNISKHSNGKILFRVRKKGIEISVERLK